MPLIDDRGRLFGRLNIIDAALVAFVLVLVPIGFTAARLFRVPNPIIERVDPAQAVGPRWRMRLHGRDFRPYLRAFVGPTGQPFSIIPEARLDLEGVVRLETPSVVEVELPKLVAGQYDLYLYDQTREVAHLPAAFTIPGTIIQARIRFSVPAMTVVKAGDVDVTDQKTGTLPGFTSGPAVLTEVNILNQNAAPAFDMLMMSDKTRWFGWTQQDARVIEASVTIPARQNAHGVWEYGELTIRAGDPFLFQTTQYSIRGVIEETTVSPGSGAASKAGK